MAPSVRDTHGTMRRILITTALAVIIALALLLEGDTKARATPEVAATPTLAVAAAVARSAPRAPGTTILVLRLGARGLELVSACEKETPCETSSEGRGAWRLEDASSGARLADGLCDFPDLCHCSLGRDHAQGCIVIRHEAVFRLKVPRRAPHERLRVFAPDGREAGSFVLDRGER